VNSAIASVLLNMLLVTKYLYSCWRLARRWRRASSIFARAGQRADDVCRRAGGSAKNMRRRQWEEEGQGKNGGESEQQASGKNS